jgi:hypothetical protein
MSEKPPTTTPTVEKLAYSSEELCAALGLSKVSIWRLEKRGLLEPIVGLRHKRYSSTAVHRFLNAKAAP